MKRISLNISLHICLLCMILAVMLLIPVSVTAQSPTETAVPTTVAPDGNTGATSGETPEQILEKAERAAASAQEAMDNVNLILGFIQVAGLVGTLLIGITGTLLTVAGIRTIRDYQSELEAARKELSGMREQLQEQASAMRSQSVKAIRALSLLQLGEQQLEAKNMQSAMRTYQEAYALDPDNPATNYFLGHIYTQNRQIEKGIEHLKRALAQNTQYPPAEAALAYALRLQADKINDPVEKKLRYAESEQMFLRALSQDPAVRDINGESVHAVLGGLYKRLNRTDEAIQAYQAAEQVTPQNSYPIINLATLHYLRGDQEHAKAYYQRSAAISERLLDANPFDYWTRFDLASAQLVLGRLAEAKRELNIAIQHVGHIGPLDTFLHDLDKLKDSPTPPNGLEEMTDIVRGAIDRLRD